APTGPPSDPGPGAKPIVRLESPVAGKGRPQPDAGSRRRLLAPGAEPITRPGSRSAVSHRAPDRLPVSRSVGAARARALHHAVRRDRPSPQVVHVAALNPMVRFALTRTFFSVILSV